SVTGMPRFRSYLAWVESSRPTTVFAVGLEHSNQPMPTLNARSTLLAKRPGVEGLRAALDFCGPPRQTTIGLSVRHTMSSSRHSCGSAGEPHGASVTSRSLLERVKADEAAAWERLVTLYAPLVFHWCRRWDLREPDIADILQDVFQSVVVH